MSDPICRVQNPYPKNVVKLVKNLPHQEMTNESFKKYMTKSEYGADSFFKTYYQLACQLGLYFIDDKQIFHPRFQRDITEKEALNYLMLWFSRYYVPNPYTRGFIALQKPILVEDSLYEYTKVNGSTKDILNVCKDIFKEDIGNPDIFINAINSFSKKIKISDRKIKLQDFGGVDMESNNNRDDKKAFFDTFNSDSKDTLIPYSFNRIVFGAPGTGKSFELNKDAETYFKTEIAENEENKVQFEIEASSGDNAKCFAIGYNHSNYLKDKTQKDLRSKYRCSNPSANSIVQGIKAKSIESKFGFYSNDTDHARIQEEINKIGKDESQAGFGIIGRHYAEYFGDRTYKEIFDDFDLNKNSSNAYWIKMGMTSLDYSDDVKGADQLERYERVTFHPNYSYAQFVGTYKPVSENGEIKYSYVPGPFIRILVKSLKYKKNFLLLIEEINRANVAAVFGDVFQLLDRDSSGRSQYSIDLSEDLKKYLSEKEGINLQGDKLYIPNNMYIWATMNSADQGVMPMDAAFKRRWDFEYLGINENQDKINKIQLPFPKKADDGTVKYVLYNWNKPRIEINRILQNQHVNEDKLLGPFFISKSVLDKYNGVTKEETCKEFTKLFKSKVLMYIFEDAAKMRSSEVFELKKDNKILEKPLFSDVYDEFDSIGLHIFKGININPEKSSEEPEEFALVAQNVPGNN